MGFWDFVKTAIIVEGVSHMLKSGKKKTRNGYDPGAWRRDIDKENDSYNNFFNENEF